jgi:hypothetical protein
VIIIKQRRDEKKERRGTILSSDGRFPITHLHLKWESNYTPGKIPFTHSRKILLEKNTKNLPKKSAVRVYGTVLYRIVETATRKFSKKIYMDP